MKKLFYLFALSILTAFTFLNCEKETIITEEENFNIQSKIQYRNLTLNEIPDIESFIIKKTKRSIFKSSNKNDAIFDVENIMEVIDSTNQVNYSFSFLFPDTPLGTFYNLIINRTPEGVLQTPYVLKFVCDKENLNDFISNNYNYKYFKGSINLHKYTDFFDNDAFFKLDTYCPKEFDEYGDPIPCDVKNVDGSGNSRSGGSSEEGGDSGSSGTSHGSGSSSNGGSSSGGSSGSSSNGGGASSNCSWGVENIPTYPCPYADYGSGCLAPYLVIDCGVKKPAKAKNNDDCPGCPNPSGSIGVNNTTRTWNENTVLFEDITDPVINDINDYLKCFDKTKEAKITIYVDQPINNSRATYFLLNPGHTFVTISQNGVTRSLGFYPQQSINPISGNIETSSTLNNNEGHEYDISISKEINAAQLSYILSEISNYNSTYNLDTYNCTDFGIEIAESAGIKLPDSTGNWPGGSGSNPGHLGQDIRNMNPKSGISIDKTKGKAPSNSGTCN